MANDWTKKDLETYCFRCGVKVIMKNPHQEKGEAVISGKCPRCSQKIVKVLR